MTKEYDTIASLWHAFYDLMRSSGVQAADESMIDGQNLGGLPGTGGHIVTTSKEK
jgi:DASH complex subunit DAD1